MHLDDVSYVMHSLAAHALDNLAQCYGVIPATSTKPYLKIAMQVLIK